MLISVNNFLITPGLYTKLKFDSEVIRSNEDKSIVINTNPQIQTHKDIYIQPNYFIHNKSKLLYKLTDPKYITLKIYVSKRLISLKIELLPQWENKKHFIIHKSTP